MPHLTIDPVLITSHMIVALQQIVSRNAKPSVPSVLSFGKVIANGATNVIPAVARARVNIRFNDKHKGADLVELVCKTVAAHAPKATIRSVISGESFITPPGDFSALVSGAIGKVTGLAPELSTTGGTSDARFLSRICPVVEFGLCNATMHKLDEAVAIDDLHALTDIYADVIRRALGGAGSQGA